VTHRQTFRSAAALLVAAALAVPTTAATVRSRWSGWSWRSARTVTCRAALTRSVRSPGSACRSR